jgi:hypothetical protein
MERRQRLRKMIRDLGRALTEAISESSDACQSLHRIQEEGYALFLLVGSTQDPDATAAPSDASVEEPAVPRGSSAVAPAFRIDGRDLAFLRSIGIDPTRKVRSRTSTAVKAK